MTFRVHVQGRSDPTEGPSLVALVDDIIPALGDSAPAQLLCTLKRHSSWWGAPGS